MDPLREEAHRQVMRLYAWSGQRNAAIHQYRECVGILEQELGVTPLAETTELYEAIKGNTLPEQVDLRSRPKPVGSPASSAVDLPGLAEGSARSLPLVGRAADLAGLIHSYEQHGAGGYFVAIEGEAGIGKTRLAEEFLAHARAEGATTITVRCFEGEAAVAYGPIADGLRAALRERRVRNEQQPSRPIG